VYLERSMLDFLHPGSVRLSKRVQAAQLGFSQQGASGGSKLRPPTFEHKDWIRS
jgi:hypothetical protein